MKVHTLHSPISKIFMIPIERLHAQLHASAGQNLQAVAVPPFVCYFHPTETAVFANYAIPSQPIDGDVDDDLAAVIATFRQRQRTPRFEYLQPFAPALAQILEANGFVREMESYLMVCQPPMVRPVAVDPALVIRLLGGEGEETAVKQAFVTVQARAFGRDDQPTASIEEAEAHWRQFAGVDKFMAWWNGEPAGVGSLTQPHDGVAEVAGVATLVAFRRRGVGTAVTHHIATYAFANGLDTLFLTAGDERAGRVYAQVGFQHIGSGLAYIL